LKTVEEKGWKNSHNEEFHTLSASANIKVIKSGRTKWLARVAQMER